MLVQPYNAAQKSQATYTLLQYRGILFEGVTEADEQSFSRLTKGAGDEVREEEGARRFERVGDEEAEVGW